MAVLLVPSSVAFTPTVNINDSGATTSNYETLHIISTRFDFSLTTASPIVGGNAWVGKASHSVNFTHASLGAVTNPNQNFSLASETNGCAAKLAAIAIDHVEVNSVTSGCAVAFSYSMPSAYASLSIPQTVLYTFGGNVQTIQQAAYFTLASSFALCATPCVFQNSANRTLIVKTPSSGLSTLDFYFPQYSGGGSVTTTSTSATVGGGGITNLGGGGIVNPALTTPTSSSQPSTSTSTIPSFVGIATVVVVLVVIVALVLGRVADSGPFRQPSHHKSNPRRPGGGKPDWNR